MSISRFRRIRGSDEADVDMTPMLDIVFIMLIFFIVTATFLDESAIAMTEPPETPPIETITPTISVYIDANDRVSLDSEVTQLSAVSSRVERLLADKPDANILLTTDAEATHKVVVGVQDQMNAMGRATTIRVNRREG